MTERAVVTGANRGIGREIARQLVERGVEVVLTSRDAAAGEREAEVIGARAFPLDVTDRESIAALAAWMKREHGGFDILVNNAGAALKGFDADVVRTTLAVNFYGAVHSTDALLSLLREEGRIVNISSGMGELSVLADDVARRFADPELDRATLFALMEEFQRDVEGGVHRARGWPSSAYSVSKVGLNAFTRVMARELEEDPRGLRVNAACPGWVRTAMGGAAASRSVEEGADTPVWLACDEREATGAFFRDRRPIPW